MYKNAYKRRKTMDNNATKQIPESVMKKFDEIKDLVYKGYTEKVQRADGKMVNDLYVKEPRNTSFIDKETQETVERYSIKVKNHNNEEIDYNMSNGRCDYIIYTRWGKNHQQGDKPEVNCILKANEQMNKEVLSESLRELSMELDKTLEPGYERNLPDDYYRE